VFLLLWELGRSYYPIVCFKGIKGILSWRWNEHVWEVGIYLLLLHSVISWLLWTIDKLYCDGNSICYTIIHYDIQFDIYSVHSSHPLDRLSNAMNSGGGHGSSLELVSSSLRIVLISGVLSGECPNSIFTRAWLFHPTYLVTCWHLTQYILLLAVHTDFLGCTIQLLLNKSATE